MLGLVPLLTACDPSGIVSCTSFVRSGYQQSYEAFIGADLPSPIDPAWSRGYQALRFPDSECTDRDDGNTVETSIWQYRWSEALGSYQGCGVDYGIGYNGLAVASSNTCSSSVSRWTDNRWRWWISGTYYDWAKDNYLCSSPNCH